LCRNCLRDTEGEKWQKRGRRSKQLLNYLKETSWYWQVKEEALDRPFWRTGFGRVYGPVLREVTERKKECTNEWMIEWMDRLVNEIGLHDPFL
jgi:hypothetical protein